MLFVGLHGLRVTGAQREAGVGFPLVVEASRDGQLVVGDGVAPVGEHAAASDSGELGGVAHGDEAPPVAVSEDGEAVEVVGRGHARFVEYDRRARLPR